MTQVPILTPCSLAFRLNGILVAGTQSMVRWMGRSVGGSLRVFPYLNLGTRLETLLFCSVLSEYHGVCAYGDTQVTRRVVDPVS